MLEWSLVGSTVRLIAVATAVGAMIVLIARRSRRWWLLVVPAVVTVGIAVGGVVGWAVKRLQPFGDYTMPLEVLVWIAVAVAGLGFGLANFAGSHWRRRVVTIASASLVLVSAVAGVNAFYGYRPNLRSALDMRVADEVAFTAVPAASAVLAPPDPQRSLSEWWVAPAAMPRQGVITRVHIGAPTSGFRTTRDAFIYLPPAYLAARRPLLPVLVAFHSAPGSPADWVNAGQLSALMDRFAAANRGLAPIVVMPDTTGTALANPMCVDSALGNSETYLTRDVPDWILRNLQVNPDTRQWAVGGFSSGGTCALQLALRKPELYPTFLDIAGQVAPTLGDTKKTILRAFGGNAARFDQLTPLAMLARGKYPSSAGRIYDGADDPRSIAEQKPILAAAARNGIDLRFAIVPGSHTWTMAAHAFEQAIPWLAGRQGITRRSPP